METKVCECCGRELPIEQFPVLHFGASKICRDCKAQKIADARAYKKRVANMEQEIANAKTMKLSEFTARELIKELASRGYVGKLEYVERHVIDLKNI